MEEKTLLKDADVCCAGLERFLRIVWLIVVPPSATASVDASRIFHQVACFSSAHRITNREYRQRKDSRVGIFGKLFKDP